MKALVMSNWKNYVSKTPMDCHHCGLSFHPQSNYASSARKSGVAVFCNKEDCKDARKKHLTQLNRENMQRKLANGLLDRMKNNNPMKDPEIRKKARDKLINSGHKPRVRGGNGTGMTIPQELLFRSLGEGWVAEYSVRTFQKSGSGYPHAYKMDIAHPQKMIAIEVDGNSHNSYLGKHRDAKKNYILGKLGWSVLRFKNKEVMEKYQEIALEMNLLKCST